MTAGGVAGVGSATTLGAAVAAAGTAAATTAEKTAAAAHLQERPKYVYGQDPTGTASGTTDQQTDDEAIHGAYSTQPHVQTSYNAEAYGNYAHAQYDDGTGGYQDAQRQEYQGQHQAYYDQQQYAQGGYDQTGYVHAQGGYDQHQQYYDYSQYAAQPQAHGTAGGHDAYGGM